MTGHNEVVTTLLWFNEPERTEKRRFISGSIDMTIKIYEDFACVGNLTAHKGNKISLLHMY